MNSILAYEQGYITFEELETIIWDFGPNRINEVGEKCFAFYCSKANGLHNFDYYILKYGSGLNAKYEWYCE
ncbi:hypothetical protein P7E02_11280 [Enterococcus hulanensis]|nr:hypothetical protein [Enterococcus hulanensis]